MNNRWNGFIYKLWSPIYDWVFNTGKFLKARKDIFQDKSFTENQKMLIVGVGTGADLELIQFDQLEVIAIDYSADMLKKAKDKFKDSSIQFQQMDAQHMEFHDNQFDIVIASLILSVVPDADASLKEMMRVLKPNGVVIIFDKFAPKDKELSPIKKMIRPFAKVLGTDIGISFERLCESNKEILTVKEDRSVMLNGMYRKIILGKVHT